MSAHVDDPSQVPPAGAAAHTRIAAVSFGVGVLLLGVKFWAYALTSSQAIFSDALESIVNVVAAGFAWFVVGWAGQPADRDHPFGHGKIEFVSAAFEGALIFGAALVILWQAGIGMLEGAMPQRLDFGLVLTGAAGAVNGLLGWWLVGHGRRHHSAAIEADGHHLLSDFWTTVGVVAGLGLVRLTGLAWIDGVVAAVVALHLLATGWKLVRRAGGALLDEEDPELLRQLVNVLAPKVKDGVIRLHNLRAIRAGRFRHFSAHLVVPEFWTVQQAHDTAEALAARLLHEMPGDGDIDFHTDPCERRYCTMCDLDACSVRQQPFVRRAPLTVDEAVAPDADLRVDWTAK
ncbi:MAG: cation transporter [Planctomycetes bacterium]|nr:cation transporter [Planctomycetota bacterium]